jgi:hypothetical protein
MATVWEWFVTSKQQPEPPEETHRSDFRMRDVYLLSDLKRKVIAWFRDQVALCEALCVAVTVHVLLFPLIWVMGWALPWPRTPERTIVIELNIEHWPQDARPERIEELYNVKRAQARQGK